MTREEVDLQTRTELNVINNHKREIKRLQSLLARCLPWLVDYRNGLCAEGYSIEAEADGLAELDALIGEIKEDTKP